MSTAGVTGSYPAVGSEIARAEYDALLETLSAWINDRGQRLVELDERSVAAEASQRTDVGLAFVLWQAISERRDELVGIDWRDHQRPNGEVATLVWRGIDDRTGAPLAADLAEAVALVDELIRRVAGALDHSDTSNVARHEARMSVETDLAVAERLAAELGDQVRAAADLRRELTRLTSSPVSGGASSTPELDDAALAELRAAAARLRVDLEATDRERRAALDACSAATASLDRLRALESDARAAVAECVDRFADPPRLGVPSVDAVEVPPADLAGRPWPQARPMAEAFLRTVDRLERALRHVIDVNTAPRRERDDLRGLLQAYRDKADAHGAAERPDVDAAYRAARDVLWSAPCDLGRARELTTDFQRLVGAVTGSAASDGSNGAPSDGPAGRPVDETEAP
ncbi:MAG TPA: hypothetical protein PKY13_14900 [Microthrixaceae bacterium]|nr:hypothetical protein [Microthrixaceae bacterium]